MRYMCYVCGNIIQSNDYTVIPQTKNKGKTLYRHKTKCYPNSAKWNKNSKLKRFFLKEKTKKEKQ